ncbi:MAG TPA: hypothetical protein VF656_11490 [Pyrinomonadaceae bacterium]|jgi:hypothetical protein
MTRVLFWNLQTFGINKINDPSIRRGAGIGGLTLQQASAMRRALVANIIVNTAPEIIVLVEVASGDSYPDDLATNTDGWAGALYLLNQLRAANPAMGWRLVPPLRVGRRPGSKPETVAVLYQGVSGAVRRYFTGPNLWVGGVNGNSTEPGFGVVGNAYPAARNLDTMLVPPVMPAVPARNIPAGALHNGGLAENVVAARTHFRLSGAPAYFVDYQIYRPPYMVTFTEADAMGNVQRNLTLFGVHSPAVAGDPGVFIVYLQNTEDVVAALGANETRVIGGDFNLSLLAANGGPSNVYAPLGPNYVPLLQSAAAPPAPNLNAYLGYFATHIKRKYTANTEATQFLWSDPPNASPYPGYGYIGSKFVANFYSIDNILVWPHQGAPYNYQTTIMNGIVGTPFNAVAPIPGGAPPGTVAFAQQMTNAPVGWPPAPNAPRVANIGGRNSLTSWANYGYQYSTSDHFAVFARV